MRLRLVLPAVTAAFDCPVPNIVHLESENLQFGPAKCDQRRPTPTDKSLQVNRLAHPSPNWNRACL
jgi:hypothetical protein